MRCSVAVLFLFGSFLVSATAAEPPVTAVAFAPDGESVVAASQAGLRVLSWPDLKPGRSVKTSATNLHALAFSPAGDRLAIAGGSPAEEGVVEILSWPEGKSLRVLRGHEDSVMAVAWRDKSSLASAGLDHEVILWDAADGSPTRRFKGHSRGVTAVCFLNGGETLVSSGIDQSLRVWDVDSGDLTRGLGIHTQPVHDLAPRPGDASLPMIASVSDDRTVRLWQPTIGRMVRFVKLESEPLDAEWLPDGSRVAVACADGHVRLIDPDEVKVTQNIPAVDGWAYALAVHPTDGTLAVGGGDGQLKRVDPNPE